MSSAAPHPTRALRHASPRARRHPAPAEPLPAVRARGWRRTARAANGNTAGRRAGGRKANGSGASEGRGPRERLAWLSGGETGRVKEREGTNPTADLRPRDVTRRYRPFSRAHARTHPCPRLPPGALRRAHAQKGRTAATKGSRSPQLQLLTAHLY